MRIAVAAVAALFITPASAQIASDCNGTAFLLRSFPRAVVVAVARSAMPDPDNTRFGTIAGRCLKPGDMTVVCGVAARVNVHGYISRKVHFHGLYKNGDFVFLGTGAKSEFVCREEITKHMPL